MKKTLPIVLTFAGSDPSGGAGLQADLRVMQALGCYGVSVVTALTAQSTLGVDRVWLLPSELVEQQAETLLNDIRPTAVKIGMVGNSGIAQIILRIIEKHNLTNIVADTILRSTSGAELYEAGGMQTFRQLLAKARVITPNLPEASALIPLPHTSVYLKGGHAEGNIITDTFSNAEDGTTLTFTHPRVETPNTHGTGCVLSSALASFLAKSFSLNDAAAAAHSFMQQAFTQGTHLAIGHGHGPAFAAVFSD